MNLSTPGKYLLIDIGGVREQELEDVFIALHNLRDSRGLRIQVIPQIMWIDVHPWKANENKNTIVCLNT